MLNIWIPPWKEKFSGGHKEISIDNLNFSEKFFPYLSLSQQLSLNQSYRLSEHLN